MSTNCDFIDDLPRRPLIADASASTIIAAIAGGLLVGPIGLFVGAAAGNALASQRQPLEMAIRGYMSNQGLEVVFFYPSPRAVKVTFRNRANAYWTVESVLPDHYELPPDDTLDWLYGNFVANVLPNVLSRIRRIS
ncbi:MAG TPA: hypothetical protein VN643_03915 [Pyrinomonadaceae bacterium]|nr:hypothetical protein [Pyrinomonadaceae bacterium]